MLFFLHCVGCRCTCVTVCRYVTRKSKYICVHVSFLDELINKAGLQLHVHVYALKVTFQISFHFHTTCSF